jgi:hypothetical protein
MKSSFAILVYVLWAISCNGARLFAQSQVEFNSAKRIAVSVDESQLVVLNGNIHPFAKSSLDRGPAPASNPTGRIQLVLRRTVTQQQALSAYLSDLQNPASVNYHKWLTPAQYGARFGLDASDIQTIESWLQSHGLRIDNVSAAQNIISFSGTIDQIQSAFHTSIHAFVVRGKTRFANATDVKIPFALLPVIAGIGPLNNFESQPDLRVSASGIWDSSTQSIQPSLTLFDANNTPYLFVDPADAATIYDTPNGTLNTSYTGTNYNGSGVTIGIVGLSNLYMPDIENYRTGFLGESTTNVNLPAVIIDGSDPGVVPGGAGLEAVLDNEVAGGLAPGAKIAYYTSAGSDLSDGLFNAIARAVDDNAVDILNLSFGMCEAGLGSSGNQLILELAQQAASQGISLTVSAGDGGAAGCDNFNTASNSQQGFAVNGLASTPYGIAIGGTDFDVLSSSFSNYVNTTTAGIAPYYLSAKDYIPEKPWNDSTTVNVTISQNVPYTGNSGKTNIVAGSGGVSTIYSKPAFQTSLTPADGHRDLPDVSLLAGDGLHSALWVVCGDSVIEGRATTAPSSDCANTGGQFNGASTFLGVGGTSAAAPTFAGILALIVQKSGGRLGQADSVLYQLARVHPAYFHDITDGNNSVPCAAGSPNCGSNGFLAGYNATSGYDLATGLGSVDAAAVVNNWSSVSLATTSTTLQINGSSSAYSGVHGSSLTFDVGVTGPGGSTPTGPVAITDDANETAGGTASGPQENGQLAIPLIAGTGSTTYNGLPGGTYAVTARYGGDTAFAASTSAPISVSIAPEPSDTALTVNAYDPSTGKAISGSNIPYGSYIIADADVTGTAEGTKTQGVATGTVRFMNGGTILGSGVVSSSNQATWFSFNGTASPLQAGSYILTAQYSGDSSFEPSTSSSVAFNVVTSTATVSAQSTLYTMTASDSASILAYVNTPSNSGVAPTGSVTISAHGTTLATISSLIPSFSSSFGSAAIQASQLAAGINVITVRYNGDSNYSSSSTTLAIDNAGTGGFSINPISNVAISPGGSVIVPITLMPSGGFVGDVEFNFTLSGQPNTFSSGVVLPVYMTGSGPTSTAFTLTASSGAAAGTYTAVLNGLTNSNPRIKASAPFTITVGQQRTPSIALYSNGNLSVSPGATSGNASSVTILPFGGYAGQLNLACAVTTSIGNAVSPPTCSVPASVTIAGNEASVIPVSVLTSSSTTTGDYTVSVKATDASTPAVTGSSVADLTVTLLPQFALSGSSPVTFTIGATTGNSATLTATSFNGYSGIVNLTCVETVLSTVSGYMVTMPSCTVPPSIQVASTGPTSFTLTLSATGNPSYPPTGVYLFTVSGYDTTQTNIASQTPIAVVVGKPFAGLGLSSGGSIAVNAGATSGNTSTITVIPSGGFTGTVNMACRVTTNMGSPNGLPNCQVPASVSISGTGAATATLTVSTNAPTSRSLALPLSKLASRRGGIAIGLILLSGVLIRRRTWRALLIVFVATLIIGGAVSCGGGSGSGRGNGSGNPDQGTTPGNYSVIVTGTDAATGTITASTTVSLTVN